MCTEFATDGIGFALLTAILSVATVAGMIIFTWLTLAGMRRINLGRLEKYELGSMGALLCAVRCERGFDR